MDINQAFGDYLNKDDIPPGTVWRGIIFNVVMEEIKGEHGTETKPVMHFQNETKGFVINSVNKDRLASLWGNETDHWIGQTLELHVDPTVMFGGKAVGGVRVKMPIMGQQAAAQPPGLQVPQQPVQHPAGAAPQFAGQPAPQPAGQPAADDEIPF